MFDQNIILDIPRESRLNYCQDLVIKKLPDQNYVVLKYLMEFLCLVTDRFAVETAGVEIFIYPGYLGVI